MLFLPSFSICISSIYPSAAPKTLRRSLGAHTLLIIRQLLLNSPKSTCCPTHVFLLQQFKWLRPRQAFSHLAWQNIGEWREASHFKWRRVTREDSGRNDHSDRMKATQAGEVKRSKVGLYAHFQQTRQKALVCQSHKNGQQWFNYLWICLPPIKLHWLAKTLKSIDIAHYLRSFKYKLKLL